MKNSSQSYPGGFLLTLKKARELVLQEFGTAKGLKADESTQLKGFFRMELGNLVISVRPDIHMSGCIEVAVSTCTTCNRCITYFNRDTLAPDYKTMDKYEDQKKQEALEAWVYDHGAEFCHKKIDEIRDRS